MADPFLFDLSDAAYGGIGKLGDFFMPGSGDLLSGLAGNTTFGLPKMMSMLFGMSTSDPLYSSVLMSNMTPYGVSRQQRNSQIQSISNDALDRQRQALKYKAMEGMARTATSKAAWDRMSEEARGGFTSYDDFIRAKTNDYANNFAFNAAYQLYAANSGDTEAMHMLSSATANMIRHRVNTGDRRAYSTAGKVIGNMFLDANRNDTFNSADYGNLSRKDVAAVTAALTKDIDFLEGMDNAAEPDRIRRASEKLKTKVKKYSEALSALKDVFGDDVSKMVTAVEEFSGQSFSSLSASRVRQISNTIMNGVDTGRYSMQEFAAANAQVQAAFDGMDTTQYNKINAFRYATKALDSTYGGIMPGNMTKKDFISRVSNGIVRSAASTGADLYNKGYALWKEQNKNGTIDQFKQQLEAAQRSGTPGGIMGALRRVVGVQNKTELEQGVYLSGYEEANNAGLGQDLAVDATLDKAVNNFKLNARGLTARRALRRATGRTYTRKESEQLAQETTDLLQTDPTLINATGEELEEALAEKLKLNKDSQKVKAIAAMTRQMKATNPDLTARLTAKYNLNRQIQREKNIEQDREFDNAVSSSLAGSGGELLGKIFGLDTGKGFDIDNIKDIINNIPALNNIATNTQRTELASSIKFASEAANSIYGNTKDTFEKSKKAYIEKARNSKENAKNGELYTAWLKTNGKENTDAAYNEFIAQQAELSYNTDANNKKDFIASQLRYSRSIAAKVSDGYINAKERWEKAKTSADKEAAATEMIMYSSMNSEAVDEHFKNMSAEDKNKELKNINKIIKENQGDEKSAIANYVANKSVFNKLTEATKNKKDSEFEDLVKNFQKDFLGEGKTLNNSTLSLGGTGVNGKTVSQWFEDQRKAANGNETQLGRLNELERAINEGRQGRNATASPTDVLKSLTAAIDKLVNFMSRKPAEANTQTNPKDSTRTKTNTGK